MGDWKNEGVPTGTARMDAESEYLKKNGYTIRASSFINTLLKDSTEGMGLMVLFDSSERVISEFSYVRHDTLSLGGLPTRIYQTVDDALHSFEPTIFASYEVPFNEGFIERNELSVKTRAYSIHNGMIEPFDLRAFLVHNTLLSSPWAGKQYVKAIEYAEAEAYNYDIDDCTMVTLDATVQERGTNIELKLGQKREVKKIPMNTDTKIGLALLGATLAGSVIVAGLIDKYRRAL